MAFVAHPVVDEWPEDLFVYEARHASIVLSSPIRAFLEDARDSQRRAVLVTPATSTISRAVAEMLREADGRWVVRTLDHRLFDALTGYEIDAFDQLWEEPSEYAARLDTFAGPPVGGDAFLLVDVYARERASEATRFGALAEHLAGVLGSSGLDSWGLQEPTTRRWDREALTASLRARMPVTAPHYAGGADGTSLSMQVARTRSGLLEHTRGLIRVGEYDQVLARGGAPYLARHPRVAGALRGLAESFRPTVAMLSLSHGVTAGRLPGQRPESRWPDQPVAVLIGARAVRDLAVDLEQLSRTHDLAYVGSRRAPSILLRLTGPEPSWHQFVAFAHDLDQERLASALAMDVARFREEV